MTTVLKAGRREWIGLGVLLFALMIVSMDVSILYFAVPYINHDLNPSGTQQLWMFDIYGFVLAGMLVTMGSLGDRIGRRRLLLIGAAAFGLTSVAAAYAQSPEMLILARALLGISGATLMPSTLGLIRNMFHDEKQRTTAVSIWTVTMTMGVGFGPILSGLLLENFWWGSVFLVSVVPMALLLILAPLLVPEFRNPGKTRFDLLSSFLSLATILPIIYGIKESAANGWTLGRAGYIVAGVVIGLIFLRRQAKRADPMLDLSLFRKGAFSGSISVNLLAMFSLVGFAVFNTQYLQLVLNYKPLEAALWSLLPSVAVGAVAPITATLVQRGVNRSYVMAAGFIMASAGLAVLSQVKVDSGIWPVMIGAGILGGGLVAVMSQATELVVGVVTPERAGSASALLETSSELGGALGIAVLGSLGAAAYRQEIGDSLASDTLAGALLLAEQSGPAGAGIAAVARQGFIEGMHLGAYGAIVAMLLGAVISVAAVRKARLVVAVPELVAA